MSIASALSNAQNIERRGPSCDVCIVLARSTPEDAAALLGALSDPELRYSTISDALSGTETPLSAGSLSRHARGRCLARERLR